MKEILNWIKTHKALVAIITVLVFTIPLVVVHFLFKWYSGIPWLEAEWLAGDVLAYIAGFEALVGTVMLGLITVHLTNQANEINKQLGKENNYMQKIMAQKLLPVIRMESAQTFHAAIPERKPENFPSLAKFVRIISHNHSTANAVKQKIYVNLDVDEDSKEPLYVKQISFKLVNMSDTINRHISIDNIEISGYSDITEPVVCENERAGDGIATLLSTNEGIVMSVILYTKSKEIISLWENELGGLAFTMFVTNTSINGIQFKEYIEIRSANNNYTKISYGENISSEVAKDSI